MTSTFSYQSPALNFPAKINQAPHKSLRQPTAMVHTFQNTTINLCQKFMVDITDLSHRSFSVEIESDDQLFSWVSQGLGNTALTFTQHFFLFLSFFVFGRDPVHRECLGDVYSLELFPINPLATSDKMAQTLKDMPSCRSYF